MARITTKDLESFRQRLLQKRDQVMARYQHDVREGLKASRDGMEDMVDRATVAYSRELKLGDPLRIASHVLDFDEKRIHYAHEMFHDTEGYLAATNDLITLHVSLETRRAAPMPDATLARLARLKAAHAALPRPDGLSREMGLRHRKMT